MNKIQTSIHPFDTIYLRGCQWIGDATMTIPAIRALRSIFPEAFFLLSSPQKAMDIYSPIPYIDKVIPYDENWPLSKQWEHLKIIRSHHFDLSVSLAWSFNAALIPYLSRIPQRIGVKSDFRGWMLTDALTIDTWRTHQVEVHLKTIELLQPGEYSPTLEIFSSDEQKINATQRINQIKNNKPAIEKIIGVVPGAREEYRRWDPDKFVQTIHKLLAMEPLLGVVLMGEPAESNLGNYIIKHCPENRVINLIGATTLPEAIAIIQKLDLFLSNDSGLMHIATAAGIPVFAIFTHFNMIRNGPKATNIHFIYNAEQQCQKCNSRIRKNCGVPCIRNISVEQVIDAISPFIATG